MMVNKTFSTPHQKRVWEQQSKNNSRILIWIENKTAIACINKKGSVQYKHLGQPQN